MFRVIGAEGGGGVVSRGHYPSFWKEGDVKHCFVFPPFLAKKGEISSTARKQQTKLWSQMTVFIAAGQSLIACTFHWWLQTYSPFSGPLLRLCCPTPVNLWMKYNCTCLFLFSLAIRLFCTCLPPNVVQYFFSMCL